MRLTRAQGEVAKLREQLTEEKRKSAATVGESRDELEALRRKVGVLERQKVELIATFQKQLQLIDAIKRQKIHFEAAHALGLTEDGFLKELEGQGLLSA